MNKTLYFQTPCSGSQETGRCPYKKLEPISVEIDVDNWAVLKTGDVFIKKLEADLAQAGPACRSAGAPKWDPKPADFHIKPVVS